jgi:hypothetical protein
VLPAPPLVALVIVGSAVPRTPLVTAGSVALYLYVGLTQSVVPSRSDGEHEAVSTDGLASTLAGGGRTSKLAKPKPYAVRTNEWRRDGPIQVCHDIVRTANRVGGVSQIGCEDGLCRVGGGCESELVIRLTAASLLAAVSLS